MSIAVARPMNADPSAGAIGGVFAGIVALLVALGHAGKWLLNWNDARASARVARLDLWEAKLEKRETEFETRIDAEIRALRDENRAWRLAFHLVSQRLMALDPTDRALIDADEVLRSAFPVETHLPSDMAAKLDKLK